MNRDTTLAYFPSKNRHLLPFIQRKCSVGGIENNGENASDTPFLRSNFPVRGFSVDVYSVPKQPRPELERLLGA